MNEQAFWRGFLKAAELAFGAPVLPNKAKSWGTKPVLPSAPKLPKTLPSAPAPGKVVTPAPRPLPPRPVRQPSRPVIAPQAQPQVPQKPAYVANTVNAYSSALNNRHRPADDLPYVQKGINVQDAMNKIKLEKGETQTEINGDLSSDVDLGFPGSRTNSPVGPGILAHELGHSGYGRLLPKGFVENFQQEVAKNTGVIGNVSNLGKREMLASLAAREMLGKNWNANSSHSLDKGLSTYLNYERARIPDPSWKQPGAYRLDLPVSTKGPNLPINYDQADAATGTTNAFPGLENTQDAAHVLMEQLWKRRQAYGTNDYLTPPQSASPASFNPPFAGAKPRL